MGKVQVMQQYSDVTTPVFLDCEWSCHNLPSFSVYGCETSCVVTEGPGGPTV